MKELLLALIKRHDVMFCNLEITNQVLRTGIVPTITASIILG